MTSRDAFGFEHTDQSVSALGDAARRFGVLVYGVGAYLVGVVALVALILTMLGLRPFTGGPVHLERPLVAGLFNLSLLVLFALQHSLMARAEFKRRWVRVIHPAMERSTYVLATGLVLLPLLWLWQPMSSVLWAVQGSVARGGLTGIAIIGWAYLFVATFAIDHFELFGLLQVWRVFRREPIAPVPFRERWMYAFDRHPIMTGVLLGVWVTPEMTLGHLVFAVASTLYIMVGVRFEERALRRQWGAAYDAYRRRVRSLVPLI